LRTFENWAFGVHESWLKGKAIWSEYLVRVLVISEKSVDKGLNDEESRVSDWEYSYC
jgi:hypothetical protein